MWLRARARVRARARNGWGYELKIEYEIKRFELRTNRARARNQHYHLNRYEWLYFFRQVNQRIKIMTKQYQVIIVGGGPVGTALAIELGMQNIETLVLEKYSEPLLSPRAQSLNTRTMELMQRWQIIVAC